MWLGCRNGRDGLEEIGELIGPRFSRSKPRRNAVAYVRGLLSDEERKNSWTLSERAGHLSPDGVQRLLSTTDWTRVRCAMTCAPTWSGTSDPRTRS